MTKLINSFFIYATSQNLIIFSQNNFKFFLSLGLVDFMFPSNSENIICLSKKEKLGFKFILKNNFPLLSNRLIF